MEQLAVTFVVNWYDSNRMNQPDVTRHFPSEHQARVFIHEELEKFVPNATKVRLTKITTKKEIIIDSY